MVLNDKVHWICFHGCYDFAYLLKIMMNENLPPKIDIFNTFMGYFFPNVYDIKSFSVELSSNYEGGLNRLAETLGIQRVGVTH